MQESSTYPEMDRTSLKEAEPRHSGLGITSFVIAISCFVLLLIAFALVLGPGHSDPDAILASQRVGIAIAIMLLFLNIAPLLGFGLGIAGLLARRRRRVYAVLGLAFNGMMLGVMVLFWWVGRT